MKHNQTSESSSSDSDEGLVHMPLSKTNKPKTVNFHPAVSNRINRSYCALAIFHAVWYNYDILICCYSDIISSKLPLIFFPSFFPSSSLSSLPLLFLFNSFLPSLSPHPLPHSFVTYSR